MKSFFATAIIILMTLSTTTLLWADEDALRTVLDKRYALMKTAMANHDGAAMKSLLAHDFISVDIDGHTETTSQIIEEINALPNNPNKKSKTTLLSINNSDGKAFVEQKYEMTAIKPLKEGEAPQEVKLVTLSLDTWLYVDDNWYIQKTITNTMDYYVNNNHIIHKKADYYSTK